MPNNLLFNNLIFLLLLQFVFVTTGLGKAVLGFGKTKKHFLCVVCGLACLWLCETAMNTTKRAVLALPACKAAGTQGRTRAAKNGVLICTRHKKTKPKTFAAKTAKRKATIAVVAKN